MDPKQSRLPAQDAQDKLRVTALIVTRHTGQPLELCLRAVLSDPWIDQLVIVDNGNPASVASALRALRADRRDVVLLQGHGDIGFARAANLGAAHAKGRWLLFLDATVVMQRGAVERMVAAGGEARSPWVVGGVLTDTKGRARRSPFLKRLTPWAVAAEAMAPLPSPMGGAETRRRNRIRELSVGEPAPAHAVSGAMMLIPRRDFSALSGFDEGYLTHCEDLDLCRRVAAAGGAVLLQPTAEAVQFGTTARAQVAGSGRQAQGVARFFRMSIGGPGGALAALMVRIGLGVWLRLGRFGQRRGG